MIFADGAGATIIEEKDEDGGLLSHIAQQPTQLMKHIMFMLVVHIAIPKTTTQYIKMEGRKSL